MNSKGLTRDLIIEVMNKDHYMVSIHRKSKNVNQIDNKFIIRKKGGKFELVDPCESIITFYTPHTTMMAILKDIVFMKAFKHLIKTKAKKVVINYTLYSDDYMNELNEFIKGGK